MSEKKEVDLDVSENRCVLCNEKKKGCDGHPSSISMGVHRSRFESPFHERR